MLERCMLKNTSAIAFLMLSDNILNIKQLFWFNESDFNQKSCVC